MGFLQHLPKKWGSPKTLPRKELHTPTLTTSQKKKTFDAQVLQAHLSHKHEVARFHPTPTKLPRGSSASASIEVRSLPESHVPEKIREDLAGLIAAGAQGAEPKLGAGGDSQEAKKL